MQRKQLTGKFSVSWIKSNASLLLKYFWGFLLNRFLLNVIWRGFLCGFNATKTEKHPSSFPFLFLYKGKGLGPAPQGDSLWILKAFSLRRTVKLSKYSQHLPVNAQSTKAFSKRENGRSRSLFPFREHKRLFSAPFQWWSLLETLRSNISNTNTHWWNGHTRIHSGKFCLSFLVKYCHADALWGLYTFTAAQSVCRLTKSK